MNVQSYDYSKHTVEELGDEVSLVDAKLQPERAKVLQNELHKRLILAQAAAGRVHSAHAVTVGARFDELDPTTRRRFFWPFFGFSLLFAASYTLIVTLVVVIIAALIRRAMGDSGADPYKITNLVLSLAVAVPGTVIWLRQLTKRYFGGYGLRVVSRARDVAQQTHAARREP